MQLVCSVCGRCGETACAANTLAEPRGFLCCCAKPNPIGRGLQYCLPCSAKVSRSAQRLEWGGGVCSMIVGVSAHTHTSGNTEYRSVRLRLIRDEMDVVVVHYAPHQVRLGRPAPVVWFHVCALHIGCASYWWCSLSQFETTPSGWIGCTWPKYRLVL